MGDNPASAPEPPTSHLELDRPERGAKDGYLQTYFQQRLQMGDVIRLMQGDYDPRALYMTLELVAGITDDKLRMLAFEMVDKILTDAPIIHPDSVSKQHIYIMVECAKVRGHVNAFYDEFLAITHRLKAGTV